LEVSAGRDGVILRPIDPVWKEWIQLGLDTMTSLGTLAAVIVALRLASRERRDVVRARAAERQIIWDGMHPNKDRPIIQIEVTSLSSRPVTITSIGWSAGVFRKPYFFQMPDFSDPLSSKMPTTLEYGKTAYYNSPLDDFLDNNAGQMCASVPTAIPWLGARFIFVEIGTSGYPSRFRFRVDTELGRDLVRKAKELKLSKR
jgi:hypothetical protein